MNFRTILTKIIGREKVALQTLVGLVIIVSTVLVVSNMASYSLVGGDFGYFHLLDEKYAGIFGGPVDDVPSYKNLTGPYLPHAVLGRTLHLLVDKVAADQLEVYRFLEIAVIVFVNLAFYVMLKVITKKTLLALMGAIIMIANYSGFEMYTQYAYYIERVPIIPLVFFSFIFWVKSFGKDKRYYYFSVILYIIAVLLGHYALLFIPLFVSYGVIRGIDFSHLLKSIYKLALKFLPILVVTAVVFLFSVAGPFTFKSQGRRSADINPLAVLANQQNFGEKIAIQLTSVIIPSQLVTNQAKKEGISYTQTFRKFIPSAIIAFVLLTILAFRKNKVRLRTLLLTSLLGLLGTTIMNLYLDRVDFVAEMGASRLYFIPYIFFSISMSIVVYTLLTKYKYIFVRASVVIVAALILYLNFNSIRAGLGYHVPTHQAVLSVRNWARVDAPNLPKGSYVILPPQLGVNPVLFFNNYYGRDIAFIGHGQDLPSTESKIFQLEFSGTDNLEVKARDITKEL